MIEANTLQDFLDQGYTIGLDCNKCGRVPDANLGKICAAGYGGTPIDRYKPKCPKCGERLQKIVQAPKNLGGRPDYLTR